MQKRRKSKDNPYTIVLIDNKFLLKFKDSKNTIQIVELSNDIYKVFNAFELEDISMMHKVEKYIEHSEVYEDTLYKRALNKPISVEEEIERRDNIYKLKNAIENLPPVQKRRIRMYYFDDLKLEDIARIEECTFQAISKSINQAILNLRKKIE